jgi:hypothetical protein
VKFVVRYLIRGNAKRINNSSRFYYKMCFFFLLLSPIVRDTPNPSPSEIVFETVVFTHIIQWILFFCLYALHKNLYSETVYKLPRFVAHDKQMLHSSLEYLQTNGQSIGLMIHRNNLKK